MKKSRIHLTDKFLLRYRKLVRTEMIPYQWKILNDVIDVNIEKERNDAFIPNEKSHAIENLKIAAGRSNGSHYGWVFQDSDVYKWLEAVAYSLREEMDLELKQMADDVVDLIAAAQEEDGYLDTYFTIVEPECKFKRLWESHELYCAGHFMEAAVAYYETTANSQVLETARRLADCIDRNFGKEEHKIHGYDGHEEVEIGLMRLYHLTNEKRYLDLSRYFLYERGSDKDFFKKQIEEGKNHLSLIPGMDQFPDTYFQIHSPVILQQTAEGHAVRLVYLCTAMADAAATTGDEKLFAACKKIWKNIIEKRIYITGGIGSTVLGESFTLDYDLPNDTMYCETCASIGLIFFAHQMLRTEASGEYADIIERALYNTVLAGVSLDGKHFFYVNPLEVVPEKSKKDPGKSHVKYMRPEWLGCACCPTNLARLIASIEDYIYTVRENGLLVNLFMESEAVFEIGNGTIEISQKTDYPRNGKISFQISSTCSEEMTIGIRIPGWAKEFSATWNKSSQDVVVKDGFWYITGHFNHDIIELQLELSIQRWYSNLHLSEDVGKIAISRGPLVYCLEGIENGKELHLLSLSSKANFDYQWDEKLLGGIDMITADGMRLVCDKEEQQLYTTSKTSTRKTNQKLRWIPYYAWANRGETDMTVWIRESE